MSYQATTDQAVADRRMAAATHNRSPRNRRTGVAVLVILGLLLSACVTNRPEPPSAASDALVAVDEEVNVASDADDGPAEPDTDPDGAVDGATDNEATDSGTEAAEVPADLPFEEPDLQQEPDEREISESAADQPVGEPADADPDDTGDATQVDLGVGESAVCATVQIGRDAVADDNTDLVLAQRTLLIDRTELVTDDRLRDLLASIDDETPMALDTLDAALSRCENLGYRL
ncbi:MAG: hypothetical protein AAF531_22995 [Actinomycetota bacterium]